MRSHQFIIKLALLSSPVNLLIITLPLGSKKNSNFAVYLVPMFDIAWGLFDKFLSVPPPCSLRNDKNYYSLFHFKWFDFKDISISSSYPR